ncbi:hypothetical protein LCGC14_1083880 [marine sediment metagenome]|uniref:Uncharacterized protein n=1 Tax=marine sediment metagenome TaxID=412755 RepID=A0A0F9N243_9ZZZZ
MNEWKMAGGRFENDKVSVSFGDAVDYITQDTTQKTMRELDIDEASYNNFWTLVCIKAGIDKKFCPPWHRPRSLAERMKI